MYTQCNHIAQNEIKNTPLNKEINKLYRITKHKFKNAFQKIQNSKCDQDISIRNPSSKTATT